jgi:hypothetical protein
MSPKWLRLQKMAHETELKAIGRALLLRDYAGLTPSTTPVGSSLSQR